MLHSISPSTNAPSPAGGSLSEEEEKRHRLEMLWQRFTRDLRARGHVFSNEEANAHLEKLTQSRNPFNAMDAAKTALTRASAPLSPGEAQFASEMAQVTGKTLTPSAFRASLAGARASHF